MPFEAGEKENKKLFSLSFHHFVSFHALLFKFWRKTWRRHVIQRGNADWMNCEWAKRNCNWVYIAAISGTCYATICMQFTTELRGIKVSPNPLWRNIIFPLFHVGLPKFTAHFYRKLRSIALQEQFKIYATDIKSQIIASKFNMLLHRRWPDMHCQGEIPLHVRIVDKNIFNKAIYANYKSILWLPFSPSARFFSLFPSAIFKHAKNKNFLASSQIIQCIVVPDKCLIKGITMFILKTLWRCSYIIDIMIVGYAAEDLA